MEGKGRGRDADERRQERIRGEKERDEEVRRLSRGDLLVSRILLQEWCRRG